MEDPSWLGDPGTTAVWAIVLDGSFPYGCGTPTLTLTPQNCAPFTTELVLINAQHGVVHGRDVSVGHRWPTGGATRGALAPLGGGPSLPTNRVTSVRHGRRTGWPADSLGTGLGV